MNRLICNADAVCFLVSSRSGPYSPSAVYRQMGKRKLRNLGGTQHGQLLRQTSFTWQQWRCVGVVVRADSMQLSKIIAHRDTRNCRCSVAVSTPTLWENKGWYSHNQTAKLLSGWVVYLIPYWWKWWHVCQMISSIPGQIPLSHLLVELTPKIAATSWSVG
jgi:hypothetical protein